MHGQMFFQCCRLRDPIAFQSNDSAVIFVDAKFFSQVVICRNFVMQFEAIDIAEHALAILPVHNGFHSDGAKCGTIFYAAGHKPSVAFFTGALASSAKLSVHSRAR